MSGHATKEEMQLAKQLASSLDLTRSPTDQLLRLGQLYIEPLHQEPTAIKIFEAVLSREPDNVWGIYWLSYCCVHYLMAKPALLRAQALLESFVSYQPRASGALYALLAEVLHDLDFADGLGNRSLSRETDLLEESVQLEPTWIANRIGLAWAYERAGSIESAIRQLERAKQNIIQPDPTWDLNRYYFEVIVTSRIGSNVASMLHGWLDRLRAMAT